MKKSVIDIGSNSVRLFVTGNGADKKFIRSSMLARDMQGGILHSDSIERTALAVEELCALSAELGYGVPLIFATEAVRAAKNQQEFLDKLSYPLDILTGEEEARVAFLGATQGISASCGVVDIGGASVEFAYGQDGRLVYHQSLPIGCIALKNILGEHRNRLSHYIKEQLRSVDNTLPFDRFIGVGGTLTALAAMDLGLKTYDPTLVDNHILTYTRLCELLEIVFSEKYHLLSEIFATLTPTRIQIIKQGALVAILLLEHFSQNQITVSEKDNLEGYLLYKKH